MMKLLQKMENISKSVLAVTSAGMAIFGILVGIYHGIYRLNKTADAIVKTITSVENNTKFANININYDIALAEQQLLEQGSIDRLQMKKLILYRTDLELEREQRVNIDYLENKSKY